MNDYTIISASQDWPLFIKTYNKCTAYAPYSIPLSEDLIENYIIPFSQHNEDCILIGNNGLGRGIIHIGQQKHVERGGQEYIGLIYMLFAENNDIAQHLLERAEQWFISKGLKGILTFWWYPNPYKYILHGAEVYGWAGAYTMINAFRRLKYDLALDILVMSKDLLVEPELVLPEMDGLELTITYGIDNKLAITGKIHAHIDGQNIGYCGYQYLKAISNGFSKGIGQINIGTNDEFHGKGIGKALITYAHSQLYKLGARQVILATNQSLFRAIKFYEKLGYSAEPIKAYAFTKKLYL